MLEPPTDLAHLSFFFNISSSKETKIYTGRKKHLDSRLKQMCLSVLQKNWIKKQPTNRASRSCLRQPRHCSRPRAWNPSPRAGPASFLSGVPAAGRAGHGQPGTAFCRPCGAVPGTDVPSLSRSADGETEAQESQGVHLTLLPCPYQSWALIPNPDAKHQRTQESESLLFSLQPCRRWLRADPQVHARVDLRAPH